MPERSTSPAPRRPRCPRYSMRLARMATRLGIVLAAVLSPVCAEEAVQLPDFEVQGKSMFGYTRNMAASGTVIGQESIQRLTAVSLGELLQAQPGIRFQSFTGSPVSGQITLRGVGENGNQRVLVLVDGIPLNRPDIGGINWTQVPLASIESVEILRGGMSTIYGNNALAGVIRIRTRRGGGNRAEVSAAAGSYGLEHLSGWANVQAGPVDLGLSAEHFHEDGYRANSRSRSDSLTLDGSWRSASGWTVDGRATRLHSNLEFPGPLTTSQYEKDPRQSLLDGQFSEEQYSSGALRVASPEENAYQFELVSGGSDRNLDWELSGVRASDELRSAFASPRGRWTTRRTTTTIGADARLETLAFDEFNPLQPGRKDIFGHADLQRIATAGYTLVEWRPFDTMNITLGGRVEHTEFEAEYARGSLFDPSTPLRPVYDQTLSETDYAATFGVAWNPDATMRAWARYDRIYRFPATDEVAAYRNYILDRPFNDELESEHGHSLEAGVGHAFDLLAVETTAFYVLMENEISFDPTIPLNTNLPETERYGVDAAIFGNAGNLTWRVDATVQDARFREGEFKGNRRFLVPQTLASADLEIALLEDIHPGLRWTYTGSQIEGNDFSNTQPKLPASSVLDLRLRMDLSDTWSLQVEMLNALDEQYATIKYSGTWYPANGRSIRCRVRATF